MQATAKKVVIVHVSHVGPDQVKAETQGIGEAQTVPDVACHAQAVDGIGIDIVLDIVEQTDVAHQRRIGKHARVGGLLG